jgi:hypothetical protein
MAMDVGRSSPGVNACSVTSSSVRPSDEALQTFFYVVTSSFISLSKSDNRMCDFQQSLTSLFLIPVRLGPPPPPRSSVESSANARQETGNAGVG